MSGNNSYNGLIYPYTNLTSGDLYAVFNGPAGCPIFTLSSIRDIFGSVSIYILSYSDITWSIFYGLWSKAIQTYTIHYLTCDY